VASNNLRLLDLFSGIGGFSYAAEHLVGGFQTVAFVEREPFCQSILHKHWPTVPIHDDITTFKPESGSADVVCGGFPCQDISIAGKQAGIKEGTRSGLFFELMRVVRLVGPQYVVLENVAAITSNGLDAVLGTLAEAGFNAEWACIPAADVGACHRRDRWWCVAYASGADRPRWSEGCGRRQRSTADAGDCGIPEIGGGADFAADAGSQGRWQVTRGPSGNESPNEGWASEHHHLASSAGEERHGAADSTPHPNRHRLEGQNKLAGSRPEWPAAPTRLDPDWRSYLSEPVLRRGDDGLSGRVDRLKALGNAVVPQVAAIPLGRVLQLHREAEQLRGF